VSESPKIEPAKGPVPSDAPVSAAPASPGAARWERIVVTFCIGLALAAGGALGGAVLGAVIGTIVEPLGEGPLAPTHVLGLFLGLVIGSGVGAVAAPLLFFLDKRSNRGRERPQA
jgi:hypothetical protein